MPDYVIYVQVIERTRREQPSRRSRLLRWVGRLVRAT